MVMKKVPKKTTVIQKINKGVYYQPVMGEEGLWVMSFFYWDM
jgi:hypothetical protein